MRLPTLKRVISAGAPVSAKVLEQLAPLLDRPAQIYTPYGATESLPVASIGSERSWAKRATPPTREWAYASAAPSQGMEVRIIQIRDDPISTWSDDLLVPDGEIGEIVVAGPVVTREYFNRPDATGLAKIADPRGRRFIIAWGTWAIETPRAGSGSAGGSRTE